LPRLQAQLGLYLFPRDRLRRLGERLLRGSGILLVLEVLVVLGHVWGDDSGDALARASQIDDLAIVGGTGKAFDGPRVVAMQFVGVLAHTVRVRATADARQRRRLSAPA
jgi:hypothetical protein